MLLLWVTLHGAVKAITPYPEVKKILKYGADNPQVRSTWPDAVTPGVECECSPWQVQRTKWCAKGWLPMSKLKKIWQGLVGFGCNLAWLIAYLCRSYSLVGTQIQQRQQSKLGTLHFSPPGKSSLFGCKASNQKKALFVMIELVVMHLSWFSCNHVSPGAKGSQHNAFPLKTRMTHLVAWTPFLVSIDFHLAVHHLA